MLHAWIIKFIVYASLWTFHDLKSICHWSFSKFFILLGKRTISLWMITIMGNSKVSTSYLEDTMDILCILVVNPSMLCNFVIWWYDGRHHKLCNFENVNAIFEMLRTLVVFVTSLQGEYVTQFCGIIMLRVLVFLLRVFVVNIMLLFGRKVRGYGIPHPHGHYRSSHKAVVLQFYFDP